MNVAIGDRVELRSSIARWRHLGYGLHAGMKGTVEDITGTKYSLGGIGEKAPEGSWKRRFPVTISVPTQKRFWIRLDSPTAAMLKDNLEVVGCWSDEFRILEETIDVSTSRP